MSDVTISLRIDEKIHSIMKMHDEINWSAVIRKTLTEKLKQLNSIDKKRALEAAKALDKIRESKTFDKGESATKIIREWRNKRK